MECEWDLVKFGDIYEEPSRNGLTKPKKVRGTGIKFVNMNEIFAYSRMLNIDCERVPITEKEKQVALLKPLDLMFARQSLVLEGAGKCSIFLGDSEPTTFESHLIRVRINTKIADPTFIYYLFKSPQGRENIYSIVEQGAGASGIRGSDLEKIIIQIPPLPEQKVIAYFLASLDDKIDLNQRMNETLEGMAQALFKSWFVDFDPVIDNALEEGNSIPEELSKRAEIRRKALADGTANREVAKQFPSSFQLTEEMGWIPEVWELKEAESIVVRKKVNQKFTKKNVLKSGDISVFDQGSGLLLGFHNGVADIESSQINPSFIFGDHTCITHLSTKPFSVGPNVIPLGAKNYNPYWTYFAIKDIQEFQEYRRHWMEFKIKEVIVPSEKLASLFGDLVGEFYISMESKTNESLIVTSLRDTLLPKLILGEISIPDAEKLVEDAL